MFFTYLISVVFSSALVHADLVSLSCFDGGQNLSNTMEDYYNKTADYTLSFNFSEKTMTAALRLSEEQDFTPLKILAAQKDEYGDFLLSGLVFSKAKAAAGSAVAAYKVSPIESSCEEELVKIEKGMFGGFAGGFTKNQSLPVDKCLCQMD